MDRQWLATGWPRVNKLTAAAGTESERRKKEEEERGVKVIMLRRRLARPVLIYDPSIYTPRTVLIPASFLIWPREETSDDIIMTGLEWDETLFGIWLQTWFNGRVACDSLARRKLIVIRNGCLRMIYINIFSFSISLLIGHIMRPGLLSADALTVCPIPDSFWYSYTGCCFG